MCLSHGDLSTGPSVLRTKTIRPEVFVHIFSAEREYVDRARDDNRNRIQEGASSVIDPSLEMRNHITSMMCGGVGGPATLISSCAQDSDYRLLQEGQLCTILGLHQTSLRRILLKVRMPPRGLAPGPSAVPPGDSRILGETSLAGHPSTSEETRDSVASPWHPWCFYSGTPALYAAAIQERAPWRHHAASGPIQARGVDTAGLFW